MSIDSQMKAVREALPPAMKRELRQREQQLRGHYLTHDVANCKSNHEPASWEEIAFLSMGREQGVHEQHRLQVMMDMRHALDEGAKREQQLRDRLEDMCKAQLDVLVQGAKQPWKRQP